MPVVSPSRYTASSSGSYRSTLTSSSSIDKPYYRSSGGTYVTSTLRSSYGDRTTEYRSNYSDVDGKRERKTSLVEYSRSSRAPSITDSDSGISTRYRSERSESRSRDISTTRSESSKTSSDPLPRNSKKNFISSAALAMSTADLYKKYSPANYVPLTQRLQQQQQQQQNQNSYGEISRSKSISNDIGRPPAPDIARSARKARTSTAATIAERPEGRRSYKESSPTPSYSKRHSMCNGIKDDNGNEVHLVSETRKRFDPKMTVTKLPANDIRYTKPSVDQYLSQLKDCENGGYTKIVPKDDKPVPVHMPYSDKNGVNHRWEMGSSSSRSNSNSDLSISKTISEPVSLAKPSIEKINAMSTSLTSKLPSDRLASIKSQLDPNNPIGKILEKSTVIQVENGDLDYKERKALRNSPEVNLSKKTTLKNDIEKQVKAPKHTSNFASYIQISQPIASGSTPKTKVDSNNVKEDLSNDESSNDEAVTPKVSLKYIDSESADRSILDNDIDSPSGTGFENKTFEHENFLKSRTEKVTAEDSTREEDSIKSMETSTDSTVSEKSEDLSPDTPSSRRKILDIKDYDDDAKPRPEGRRSYKESSPTPSYSKRHSMCNGIKDDNGNEVHLVSETRKRFDPKMTVTKLPANDIRYTKPSVDQYLSQLKDCENGGYTKIVPKDDKPVPVHMPYSDKNGVNHRWEMGSSSSRSNSNSDLSISKTISEPVSLAKPSIEKINAMSTSLTSKLPSDRLASIKSQLDPNNPIGKILEKSTVIQVENGDLDYKERKALRNSPEVNLSKKTTLKNDIEKQVKAPKHTSNFASYIQISQPIASGSTPKTKVDSNNVKEDLSNDESSNDEAVTPKVSLKYIDSESADRSILDNDIDSPSGTGFENKTFEHENFLKSRTEKVTAEDSTREEDSIKSMETSTDSTVSEKSEDLSPDTPSSRRKILDIKDYDDDAKPELAGGKSGPSGLRRSSERSDVSIDPRSDRQASHANGLNGLRNIGNTCFMNSVLQCLSNTKPLLEYLAEDKYASEINTSLSCMKGALIKAFASVIKELWRPGERDAVVNTTSFKSQVQRFAPRFMGYSQQDAQEFLRYLLEGLHEDVNRVTIKPKPILTEIDDNLSDSAKAAEAWSRYLRTEESRVGDIFVGQLKSTLRCTHCNHDSVTFDPFWDLSLPIPQRTGNLKLQQCLQHFTKEEEMDGDEKPTCSKCGVRRKCLKWFTVQKFPQVLVVHLKRFSPTERFRGKLSVLVEFPLSGLEMGPFAAQRGSAPVYNLYAVSNHSGTTYSGHYTAYCKHPYSGAWHEYNDSRVTPISPQHVVSPEAYVLFYEMARGTS